MRALLKSLRARAGQVPGLWAILAPAWPPVRNPPSPVDASPSRTNAPFSHPSLPLISHLRSGLLHTWPEDRCPHQSRWQDLWGIVNMHILRSAPGGGGGRSVTSDSSWCHGHWAEASEDPPLTRQGWDPYRNRASRSRVCMKLWLQPLAPALTPAAPLSP